MPKDRGAEQGDVDGSLECRLALRMVAADTRGSIAARQAAGTLPWIRVNDPPEEQRLQADHAARMQESAGGPEKLTGAHDQQHVLQKSGGLADLWYMDDGDIMCHPIWVPSVLQDFDVANARAGAERSPMKTEVTYYVNDLDAAPPEWRIGDVRKISKTSAVTDGSVTSESLLDLGSPSRTSFSARCMSSEQCASASSFAKIRRQSSPSFDRVWELAVSTTSCGFTATQSWRNRGLQRSTTRAGSGLSNGSSQVSQGQHDTSDPQHKPSQQPNRASWI